MIRLASKIVVALGPEGEALIKVLFYTKVFVYFGLDWLGHNVSSSVRAKSNVVLALVLIVVLEHSFRLGMLPDLLLD